MKETLIIGNHPNTLALVWPVIDILRRNPNTTLVAGEIWKLFAFAISVIPVDLSHSARNYDHRKFPGFERTLLEFFARFDQLPVTPCSPIPDMIRTLESGNNILIFPSGATPKDGQERPWRIGTAVAVHQAIVNVPNLKIAFLNVPSHEHYQLSPAYPATEFVDGQAVPDPHITTANLRSQYDRLFPRA